MKSLTGILTGCLLILSTTGFAQNRVSEIIIHHAWIREAPPGMMSLAGYMTVQNQSNNDLSLVDVHSKDFGHVMIHKTAHESGMARMHHQNEVVLPAGQTTRFEPNGYHIMLMHPARTLKSGDKVPVTLVLSNGDKMNITFEVRTEKPAK